MATKKQIEEAAANAAAVEASPPETDASLGSEARAEQAEPAPDIDAQITREPVDPPEPPRVEPDKGMIKNFHPEKYLMKLGQKDYLQVMWRVVWLRDVFPEARIETELVSMQGDMAIFKATITLPNGAFGTGYGSETIGDFKDYLEKAETKALGRACNAVGFGTAYCGYEMDSRIVDSPINLQATSAISNQRPAQQPRSQQSTPQRPAQPQNGQTQPSFPERNRTSWDKDFLIDLKVPHAAQTLRWGDALMNASQTLDPTYGPVDEEKAKTKFGNLLAWSRIVVRGGGKDDSGSPTQAWRYDGLVAHAPTLKYLEAVVAYIEEDDAWTSDSVFLAHERKEHLEGSKAVFKPSLLPTQEVPDAAY